MKRTASPYFLCLLLLQFGVLNAAALKPSFAIFGDPVTAMATTPDGEGVVTGSHEGLFLRSGPQFRNVRRLPSEVESIHDLRFSADGKRLAVAGGTPGQFGLTEILQWPGAIVGARIRQHDDVIYSVSWSPNGRWLATAGLDGLCLICDSVSGMPNKQIEGHAKGVTGIEWLSTSPAENGKKADGNNENEGNNGNYKSDGTSLILTCSLDQTLRVWSLEVDSADAASRLVRTMDQHTGAIMGMVLQPRVSGQLAPIAASWSDDRTVRFWQPENGRLLRFARLPNPATVAAWSADGRELFAATESGAMTKISLATAEVEEIGRTERSITSLLLSRDFHRLIVGDSGGVCSEISFPGQ